MRQEDSPNKPVEFDDALPPLGADMEDEPAAVSLAVAAITRRKAQRLRDILRLSSAPLHYRGALPIPQSLGGSEPRLVAQRSTLLHLAARLGFTEGVVILVRAGAAVGAVDSDGETAILVALRYCPDACAAMIAEGRHRNLRYVNRRAGGRGLLHELVIPRDHRGARGPFRRLPLLRYLVVEYGLDQSERDAEGMTPLDLARRHYLELGAEADEIVDFLENPPPPRAAMASTHGRKFWELAKHPLCRVLLLLLLAASHTLEYMMDTVSRGTAFPNATNVTVVAVPYTRAGGTLYEPFVAYGRRGDVASLPYFGDVWSHVVHGWPTDRTGMFATKLATIVLGLVIGFAVFITLGHFLLRDLLRLRMFGAALYTRAPESHESEEMQRPDNPLTPPMPTEPPLADAEETRTKTADDGDRCGSTFVDQLMSPSPLVAAIRRDGRALLGIAGAVTGVFCGGLVYNALLDIDGLFDVNTSEVSQYRMQSELVFSDGAPVRLCDLWLYRFGICAMLSPLIVVIVVDEMLQILHDEMLIPTPWYTTQFGAGNRTQAAWRSHRLLLSYGFLAVAWGILLFLFVQNSIIFSFDDLGSTLLAPPNLSLTLWIGGVSLCLDVMVMLQSWGLPYLQSLVVVARVPEPHSPGALDATPDRSRMRADGRIGSPPKRPDGSPSRGVTHPPKAPKELSLRVADVRPALFITLTPWCGNVHWLLWSLCSVFLVLDVGFVIQYATEIVSSPNYYPTRHDAAAESNALVAASQGDAVAAVYFGLALLPTLAAALLMTWAIVKNSLWIAGRRKDFAYFHTPVVDERTGDSLHTSIPSTSAAELCIDGPLHPRRRMPNRGPITSNPLTTADTHTHTVYASPNSRDASEADVFALAHRDDVSALGSLLDEYPELLNERGGVGIRVRSSRGDEAAEPKQQQPSLPAAVPSDEVSAGSPPQPQPRGLVYSNRIAELLPVDDGARLERDLYAATPLHYAVLGGADGAVELLLRRGSNVLLRTMSGLCTAAELAQIVGRPDLAARINEARRYSVHL